jgi:hypothetical protein
MRRETSLTLQSHLVFLSRPLTNLLCVVAEHDRINFGVAWTNYTIFDVAVALRATGITLRRLS